MKTIKPAISLLLLSSFSAIAADVTPSKKYSLGPMMATADPDTKPAVDGVNGKLTVYGGVS